MKTFFLLLFFSKSVLLTSSPVNLGASWTEIELKKPISAITGGASLQVDVTKAVGYTTDFDALRKTIPDGTITAELIPEKGELLALRSSAFSYSNKEVAALLTSSSSVPVGVKYKKLRIRSTKPIHGVLITWRNSKS